MPPTASLVATYSVIAHDSATGDLGVAVQSRYFNVGTVVPWAKAGVGAVATQAIANIAYGRLGLRHLESGQSPEEALEELLSHDGGHQKRQLALIDAQGRTAAFTGSDCPFFAGHHIGHGFSVQGNYLAGPEVIEAMAKAFTSTREANADLAASLVASLQAGEHAGGDRRGRQSAALLVVRDQAGYGHDNDRFIDLRVEDHPDPLVELARLLSLHRDAFASRYSWHIDS